MIMSQTQFFFHLQSVSTFLIFWNKFNRVTNTFVKANHWVDRLFVILSLQTESV